MKERPIIFSASMVRAILSGSKSQTRRVAKPVRHPDLGNLYAPGALALEREPQHVIERACPFGQPGDRLWVRETHAIVPRTAYARSEGVEQVLRPDDGHDACVFREGWERSRPGRWRPSIHMPRWASRITLEITGVRVERLQDISEDDAHAEGVTSAEHGGINAREGFRALWESINGAGSWDANPWVWTVEFRRVAKEANR